MSKSRTLNLFLTGNRPKKNLWRFHSGQLGFFYRISRKKPLQKKNRILPKFLNCVAHRFFTIFLYFSGVPAVVDLAAMRDAVKSLGGDPEVINPICPADLVIDHSVQVDNFGK